MKIERIVSDVHLTQISPLEKKLKQEKGLIDEDAVVFEAQDENGSKNNNPYSNKNKKNESQDSEKIDSSQDTEKKSSHIDVVA
jgi:hypothetical protein